MSRRLDQTDDKTIEGLQPSLDYVNGYRHGVRAWRMRVDAFITWIAGQLSSTFAASVHAHNSNQISDSSSVGRAVVTAADEAAARTAIGAEATLANRASLVRVGEDIGGNPTWNGGPWPGAEGAQTEWFFHHPTDALYVRYFVTDEGRPDFETSTVPWPGSVGSKTERFLHHPTNGMMVRFFVSDAGRPDFETIAAP